jgi:ABC-2 type transport system permease protein
MSAIAVPLPRPASRPSGPVLQAALLTGRSLRTLARVPAYLAITLIQPAIWLLLFGQLFKSAVHIPGFQGGTSYLAFLTPGIVVMTALFSGGWAGTSFIEDMNRGVMDRLLASPASRGAMVAANLGYQAVTTIIQTMIVFGIAYAAGARFADPATGIAVTVLCAVLISVVIASLSDLVALLVRQQEALIGISQFIVLPLQFASGALIALSVVPGWLRGVARFNPVDWAVTASRQALGTAADWPAVLSRLGLLALLGVVMAVLATRAFRSYQRSL